MVVDNDGIAIRVEAAPWYRGIEFLITSRKPGGRVDVASEIIFTEQEEGQIIQPTCMLSHLDAQTLMDDLWQAGLRPSEGTGSAGALKAVEKHLKDMRSLVSKVLKVEL